jgi:predicted small lipoprotein YifL
MQRRGVLRAAVLLAAIFGMAACGAKDENHPPPTIGSPTVVERPPDAATTLP